MNITIVLCVVIIILSMWIWWLYHSRSDEQYKNMRRNNAINSMTNTNGVSNVIKTGYNDIIDPLFKKGYNDIIDPIF